MPDIKSESNFTFDKQPKFLKAAFYLLMTKTRFLKRYSPLLKPEHWPEMEAKWVVQAVMEHYEEFHRAPGFNTLDARLDADKRTTPEQKTLVTKFIDRVSDTDVDDAMREYVEVNFEGFIRYRATLHALREANEYLQDDDVDQAVSVVQQSQLIRLVDDNWIEIPKGLDAYFDYFNEENLSAISVPTGLAPFDEKLGGGLREGELGIWVAPTGFGKSMALVHCGAYAYMRGKVVLHFTFENSREETLARYAHNLLEIDSDKLLKMSPEHETYIRRREVVEGYEGRVIIVELIGASTTAYDLESYFTRLLDEGVTPGLVIVDYADFMSAGRKSALTGARWEELGAVFEELRNLAAQYDVPIWTASQANREGLKTKGHVMTHHIAGALGKANVADIIVSVSKPEKNKAGKEIKARRPLSEDGPASGAHDDDIEDEELDEQFRVLRLIKLRRGGSDDWYIRVKAHFSQARFEPTEDFAKVGSKEDNDDIEQALLESKSHRQIRKDATNDAQ